MDVKHYVDIERLKEKYAEGFKPGEHITITEKLDGSNSQILFDPETGTLKASSRRNELTPESTLQGFWNFVQTLDAESFSSILGDHYIIFGEYLIPHTIKYPEDKYRKFYVFDIWDKDKEQYLPWDSVMLIARTLNLETVPIFYDGPFISWEHVYSFVGKTEMGAMPCGEGCVVKSQDRLGEKNSRLPAYVKIVSEQFSEVHKSKPHKEIDPEKIAAKQAMEELAATIVTKRRVEKTLEKLIDDTLLKPDWDEHDLGYLAKTAPKLVYEDCKKEEPETVDAIENFGKICAKLTMAHIRNILLDKSSEII